MCEHRVNVTIRERCSPLGSAHGTIAALLRSYTHAPMDTQTCMLFVWIRSCRSRKPALPLARFLAQRTDITQQIRDTGKPRKEHQIDPKASYNLRRSDITRTRELTKYLVQTPAGSIIDNSTSSSNPAGGADVGGPRALQSRPGSTGAAA